MGITPIWPKATAWNDCGELMFHGHTASSLLNEFGSPLYVMDIDELRSRARAFVHAAAEAFPTATTHVSYAGKTFLSKEVCRIVTEEGMSVDTCTLGEMRIALAAGVPGRRLVLHGNNKTDEELELAISEGFGKIVVDSPDEPARIAAIAHRLGKRARVMLRVTSGIHAGGHEYISTAHEDQKFGVALLPAGVGSEVFDFLDSLGCGANGTDLSDGKNFHSSSEDCSGEHNPAQNSGGVARSGRVHANPANAHVGNADGFPANLVNEGNLDYSVRYPYDAGKAALSDADLQLGRAVDAVADGPAIAVLKDIASRSADLELVGVHSHIGSQIHDANAFIQAGQRMMLLRRVFYATDAYFLPEVDLGGGYSVAYTDNEDAMDVPAELERLAQVVGRVNKALGMPQPVISFEPGRSIAGPSGVTLYRVGTVKRVALPAGTRDSAGNEIAERTYVSVDGGMSDNIRPALYGADYTAVRASKSTEQADDSFIGDADNVDGALDVADGALDVADGAVSMPSVADDADGGNAEPTMLARVVGMHCESGDILVQECRLPADLKRGDILAVPVTGAYGRTMASNYNQALIPAVAAVSEQGVHLMMRRQSIDDLLDLDMSR